MSVTTPDLDLESFGGSQTWGSHYDAPLQRVTCNWPPVYHTPSTEKLPPQGKMDEQQQLNELKRKMVDTMSEMEFKASELQMNESWTNLYYFSRPL